MDFNGINEMENWNHLHIPEPERKELNAHKIREAQEITYINNDNSWVDVHGRIHRPDHYYKAPEMNYAQDVHPLKDNRPSSINEQIDRAIERVNEKIQMDAQGYHYCLNDRLNLIDELMYELIARTEDADNKIHHNINILDRKLSDLRDETKAAFEGAKFKMPMVSVRLPKINIPNTEKLSVSLPNPFYEEYLGRGISTKAWRKRFTRGRKVRLWSNCEIKYAMTRKGAPKHRLWPALKFIKHIDEVGYEYEFESPRYTTVGQSNGFRESLCDKRERALYDACYKLEKYVSAMVTASPKVFAQIDRCFKQEARGYKFTEERQAIKDMIKFITEDQEIYISRIDVHDGNLAVDRNGKLILLDIFV